LVYNIYARKTTPFNQIDFIPFFEGAVNPEDVVLKGSLDGNLVVGKLFENRGECSCQSDERALTRADSGNVFQGSDAYFLWYRFGLDRLHEEIKLLGFAAYHLQIFDLPFENALDLFKGGSFGEFREIEIFPRGVKVKRGSGAKSSRATEV
jgi:hypothetical protein